MKATLLSACLLAWAPLARDCAAYTLEYRVVERVGNTDHVLPGNAITVGTFSSHRYRLQFRVVAENDMDAPAGFIGYNVGTIVTTGGINSRTAAPPNPNPRGRLAPFVSAPQMSADGFPLADPFTSLDSIDAVVLHLTGHIWGCGADGQPLPPPEEPAYGRNEWISVFEITSVAEDADYTVTFGGDAVVGTEWIYDLCTPPDCGDPTDPSDDMPTECLIRFSADTHLAFSLTLRVNVCPGEWNDDRVLTSADFFEYMTDFFSGSADVNNDGDTDTQDYFDFMIGFLLGCR